MLRSILSQTTYAATATSSPEEFAWTLEGPAFYVVTALHLMGVKRVAAKTPWSFPDSRGFLILPPSNQCSLVAHMKVSGHTLTSPAGYSVAWLD